MRHCPRTPVPPQNGPRHRFARVLEPTAASGLVNLGAQSAIIGGKIRPNSCTSYQNTRSEHLQAPNEKQE
jgi:hypothetical protein